jgi:hypothetical protein
MGARDRRTAPAGANRRRERSMSQDRSSSDDAARFREEASAARPGLLREFWEFLKHNKKWWLLPILLILLAIGLLVILAGHGVGAFMYTVF